MKGKYKTDDDDQVFFKAIDLLKKLYIFWISTKRWHFLCVAVFQCLRGKEMTEENSITVKSVYYQTDWNSAKLFLE